MRKKLRKKVDKFLALWNEDKKQEAIAFLRDLRGHLAVEVAFAVLRENNDFQEADLLAEITKYRENN